MTTQWIFWVVGLLTAVSIVAELAAGKTRLRGLGIFTRAADPRKYWSAIAVKTVFLILIALLCFFGPGQ